MTRETFEVIVGVPSDEPDKMSNEVAAVEAGRYLGYGDQTDTFGKFSYTVAADVLGDGGDDRAVRIEFTVPPMDDDELKRFMDELVKLHRVETVERISVEE